MTYAKLPGLTWDGTVYENEEMGTLEALLPTGGWPTAHAPAMVELPNGDLLCCWFAGTYEGSADVHIICSVLPHDGTKWLEPVDISGDPTRSEQNPSLFYGPDNAVWAMYTAQLDRVEGKDNMQFTAVVRCQKSTDGGKTWTKEPITVAAMGRLHHRVPGGRHLLPSAHSGAVQRPLDLCQLAVHRLCRGSVRRPHRFPHLGR